MKSVWISWFLYGVAVSLFLAAAGVLYFAMTGGRVLDLPDALLGLAHRKVFYLVGILLLGTSAFLLINRNNSLRLLLLTWLSANLLVYHFGAAYYGSANLWAALGNLSPHIPIAPQANYLLVSVLLVGLFLGSGGLCVADWWLRRKLVKQPQAPEAPSGKLETVAIK
jgi:hypothetical protein